MKLPRFLLADNTDYPEDIFVIHTEYPRLIVNLKNDEIEWIDDILDEHEIDFIQETENLLKEVTLFYDKEIKKYHE